MKGLYIPFDGRFSFSSAGRFLSQNHSVHPRRVLESAVLLFGYSGEYPIGQDGREYCLRKGNFLLLFPETEHYGTGPASDAQSHFWFHFLLPAGAVLCEESELPQKGMEGFFLPEFGTVENTEKYFILLHQLIDAANKEYTLTQLRQNVCDSYVRVILSNLADGWMQAKTGEAEESGNRKATVARVKEWMRLHFREGITAQNVAGAFPYHADYLTQLFRSETGMTVSAYLQYLRMEEAKKMLLNTDLRVAEVAFAAGFRDEKYFMKAFKRAESVTPSEYRQAHFRTHWNAE